MWNTNNNDESRTSTNEKAMNDEDFQIERNPEQVLDLSAGTFVIALVISPFTDIPQYLRLYTYMEMGVDSIEAASKARRHRRKILSICLP